MEATEIIFKLESAAHKTKQFLPGTSTADMYGILNNQVQIMEALILSLQQQEEILNQVKNISTYNPNNIK